MVIRVDVGVNLMLLNFLLYSITDLEMQVKAKRSLVSISSL